MVSTDQRVVRRSMLYSRLLAALAAATFGLLVYAVIWSNNQKHLPQLLDVQSATAASLGTTGAALARGQYARAIKPLIGWTGRVTDDAAPDGKLSWNCYAVNAAQDPCVVATIDYQVVFSDECFPLSAHQWQTMDEVASAIEARGLARYSDFHFSYTGPGFPITAGGRIHMAWFTEAAMEEVRDVHVRLRVVDRVGDTHERVLVLLRGAQRHPTHPRRYLD